MTETAKDGLACLKFDDHHIDPILRGEKTATIRHGLPAPAPALHIGCHIYLCDTAGERFATAVVSDRGYNDAWGIVKFGVDGHRSYDNAQEVLDEMSEYYPDAELTEDSCFEIIYWEEMWE